MLQADALRARYVTLVDFVIADPRYSVAANTGPHRDALVRWSAVMTAGGATTRDEDNRMLQALSFMFHSNVMYA